MLEINKTVSTNGIRIFTSQITDNLSDLAPFFGANAETVINAAQRRFRSPKRLAERLTVEAMICAVLGKDATLYHTAEGKPYCEGTNTKISISHSRTHAALLTSNSPHCGVDIETLSPRILNLSPRIVTEDEKAAYHAISPEESAISPEESATFCDDNRHKIGISKQISEQRHILWLTTLWTIKEAVYKSMDNQNNIDLLTDIRVPSLQIDALIHGKPQQNTVYIGNSLQEKHDVTSLMANNNILSYTAY